MSKQKFQRVRIEDAHKILDNLIKEFKSPLQNSVSYDEDYAKEIHKCTSTKI